MLPSDAFTQEQFMKSWKSYVSVLKSEGKHILASIMEADTPVVVGNQVTLRFPNQSMKEDLEKSQGAILKHVAQDLNNHKIELVIKVDITTRKKYAFSDLEKFNKLVEKNPAIDLLRREFNLEL